MRSTAASSHRALRGLLRDLALASAVALLVFTAAFVAHRNHGLASAQRDKASRALAAWQAGSASPPDVRVATVELGPGPRPYLPRLRATLADGTQRTLGGADGPVADKLLADAALAAARAHRAGAPAGRVYTSARADDGVAIAAAARATRPGAIVRVDVAVTGPARPDPFPWLVVIGVLGLAVLGVCAGAVVGGAARPLALGLASAGLAAPVLSWGYWLPALAIVLCATAVAWASARGLTDRLAAGVRAHRHAAAFVAPTAIAMLVLVVTPFVVGLTLGFYDHHHGQWTFVGLDNFAEILSGGGRPMTDPLNFWFILGVTVVWTAANVVLHVAVGVALALLLTRPWLRARGTLRMLLILPWAIPNYITALIWKGMFEGEYGAINSLLDLFGLDRVGWFASWATAFSANVITNTWLGFPFMMVVAIGAIQAVPRDLYEAAEVDGATPWQRFWHVTMPHLRPAMAPAIALGSIWTFNMFNVIFLVSGGKPGGATDILVTDAYRWAFERGERYGMAAAYGTIIFLILLLWTVFGTRVVRKEAT
jgi:ABC-type sugar transport system permease subunit